MKDLNKIWMQNSKNIGCTFASIFAKNPQSIGWVTIVNPEKLIIPEGAFIVSLQFPDKNKEQVLEWALNNGFYLESLDEKNTGLRYLVNGKNIAWVQYFGKDSHVKTRQAPISELCFCVKLPTKYFIKVGFSGILHLAHASVQSLTDRKAAKLWETSFKRTEKSLGHKPTLKEGAKTTYHV